MTHTNIKNHPKIMKILLIGDSSVGKSSMLSRYVDNKFSSDFITTVGIDFKNISIKTKNETNVKLQIWDTAGQERFKTITAAYYRGAQGVILTYDITQQETFKNILHWKRALDHHASKNIKIILVGNKIDLEHLRQVSKDMGRNLANEMRIPFIEISAKDDINVTDAYSLLIEELMNIDNTSINRSISIVPIQPYINSKKCCK